MNLQKDGVEQYKWLVYKYILYIIIIYLFIYYLLLIIIYIETPTLKIDEINYCTEIDQVYETKEQLPQCSARIFDCIQYDPIPKTLRGYIYNCDQILTLCHSEDIHISSVGLHLLYLLSLHDHLLDSYNIHIIKLIRDILNDKNCYYGNDNTIIPLYYSNMDSIYYNLLYIK